MTLTELLKAVREENLTKTDLERYHLTLSGFYGDIKLETAELKKKKALFIYEKKQEGLSNVDRVNMWEITLEGQRLIYLDKGLAPAVRTQLESLKSRLFSTY
jgi:hypothetical protein